MRKVFITLCLLPAFLSAQVFKTVSAEKFAVGENEEARMAGISGDGRYIFTTSWSNQGLTRIDLDSKESRVITMDAGAGISPAISTDGSVVMHVCNTIDENHLMKSSLQLADIKEGTSQQLLAPSREYFGYALRGQQAITLVEGTQPLRRSIRKTMNDEQSASRPILVNQGLRMTLTVNGVTRNFAPNGDDDDTSYIWASLSPDGKRVLYYVSNEGTYVCDINGENLQFIAYECMAPQWYDDQTIVGFRSKDDGQFIKSSALMAYTLDGERQQLTEPDQLVMYPFCSAKTGKIIGSSLRGEIIVLNVTK